MKKRKSIRIPDSVAWALRAAAAKQGMTVAEYVRDAIVLHLIKSAIGGASGGSQKVQTEKEGNEKERSKEKVKEEKATHTRVRARVGFVPPTLAECQAYKDAHEQLSDTDIEAFFAYYTANGWTLSCGRVMRNWRAALVKWAKNDSLRVFRRAAPKEAARDAKEKRDLDARRRERLEAATKPEAWALCAERCANCREGKCSEGAKWPPQLNDWPITPEQCPKFEALASSPLNVAPSKDSSI